MISELITVSHSHRHLNDVTSLVLSRNASTEYTIQSSLSDTLAAVTITRLESFRYAHDDKLHYGNRSFGEKQSDSNEDGQEFVYSSDASVLIDRESFNLSIFPCRNPFTFSFFQVVSSICDRESHDSAFHYYSPLSHVHRKYNFTPSDCSSSA
mgnify:CR=1 FL=1